jgi:hypothetical protein
VQNPVKFVDPTGMDGVRIIDDENKTITVKAVYYVQTEKRMLFKTNGNIHYSNAYSEKDIAKMNTDINKYLNDIKGKVSEGNYKDYSVIFDLEFKAGGSVAAAESSAQDHKFEGVQIGNSFTRGNGDFYPPFKSSIIDNGDGTESRTTVGGVTSGNKDIIMNIREDNKMNKVHEIFHTFGFKHPKKVGSAHGIMSYPPQKPDQIDFNEIGNSTFLPVVKKENINNESN